MCAQTTMMELKSENYAAQEAAGAAQRGINTNMHSVPLKRLFMVF